MSRLNPDARLALALHRKLVDATERFCLIHPRTSVAAVKQAANLFLASWIANATDRAEAMASLEDEVKALREKVENAPASTFGNPVTVIHLNN